MFGWVLFRVEDVNTALQWMGHMLTPWAFTQTSCHMVDIITPQMCALLPAAALGMGPLRLLADRLGLTERWRFSWPEVLYCAGPPFVCIATLTSARYNPFIYFRF